MIFQESLNSGFIPEDWRKGVIVPIYKRNGKPTEVASYRPISLTSVVSKLLERILHTYMEQYLLSNSLICRNQHGFLKRKATATNLLECMNDWTKSVDNKCPVDAIYVDLAKAFDSVSHPKLMFKLKEIGFGGGVLEWLRSFLCSRVQCVRVQNFLSPYEPVLSGVGQGTILGPLIFLVYVNEVMTVPLSNSCLKLYADDAKLYGEAKSIPEAREIQSDLDKVSTYFNDWQLNVNVDKCEVLHLGYGNPNFQYVISNADLPQVSFCRDLGILISNDFNSLKHCTQISRNAYFKLKQFQMCFSCSDVNFQVFVFKTYIRPLLEYNTHIWSPHLIRDINTVENVQRRFTKFLPGMRNRPYTARLERLELESLEVRRIRYDLIFFYKMVNGVMDVDVSEFVSFNTNNTRGHAFKVNSMFSRLNCRKYFFVNRTINLWNSLPANIAESESLAIFKNKIVTYDLTAYCRGRAHTAV